MPPYRLHNLPNEGMQPVECRRIFRVAFIINSMQRLVMTAVWRRRRKDLQRCGHGVTKVIISAFCLERLRKPLVRIAGDLAEILTQHLPNASLERYV
jgi:hypothetical protein